MPRRVELRVYAIERPKTAATPMYHASAYTPQPRRRTTAASLKNSDAVCPALGPVDAPICEETDEQRDVGNLQADMQRYINDIKKTQLRWLPGRLLQVRSGMLHVACASGEDALPKAEILSPLWPPVPRSRDLAKNRDSIDVHGHVIGLKLWSKAVVFACKHDKALTAPQKRSLCRVSETFLSRALHSNREVSRFDRWRLTAAHEHLVDTRRRCVDTPAGG